MRSVAPTLLAHRAQVVARDTRARLYSWLDTRLFPAIVGYATGRWHILALLFLGVALMVWHDAIFELIGGNYTNIVSALVSCIVLLQTVAHRHETKRLHQQHNDDMSALHAKLDALATPPTPPTPTPAPKPARPSRKKATE